MLKKVTAIISALFILDFLVSCSNEIKLDEPVNLEITESTLASASNALVDLSPAFANVILNSNSLLKELKSKAILKEDGDYDVLFNDVKDSPLEDENGTRNVSGKTLMSGIKEQFSKTSRAADGVSAEDLIDSVPYLNLYYYSPDYEKDFESSEILMTYLDYTVDEFDQKTLVAYDKDGNSFEIDGINPPDFPVIVLGINERMDRKEYIQPQVEPDRAATYDGTITHYERLDTINYYSKYGTWDPWPRGYPEIYMIFAFQGENECLRQDFPNVDKPQSYPQKSGYNFIYENLPLNKNWVVRMYDEDVGINYNDTINLEASYNGASISLSLPLVLHKEDDLMGEAKINFYHNQNCAINLGSVATLIFNYKEEQ